MSLYPCQGGGPNDYVFIMAVTPRMWEALCQVMEREDLFKDPRFQHQKDRFKNFDALKAEIGAWAAGRDKYQAMRELANSGVPASAVLDTKDLYDNPHLNERGFVHEVEHAVHGKIKLLGWPARMSESSVPIRAAPQLGQHSREVIAEDLGLSQSAVEELVKDGVIGG